MKDLLLWRLLRHDAPPAEAVASLLHELAAVPLTERLPFFGLLADALHHADPTVRLEAVRTLAGASGVPAFRHLVEALGDPEERVRHAAVEALRRSAVVDPLRWAHALFHRDASVRRAACDGPPVPGAEWLAFHLLGDQECVTAVLSNLAGKLLPARVLPALFDFLRRGLFDRNQARSLVAGMPWRECARWLNQAQVRGPEEVQRVLHGPEPGVVGQDAFDQLFDLFWEPESSTAEDHVSLTESFFKSVRQATLAQPKNDSLRLAASLLTIAHARHGWTQPAANLGVALFPDLLERSEVPFEVRYRALGVLYEAGAHVPRRPDDQVRRLLDSDLCRRPPDGLDLWAVGAVLHLLRSEPYRHVQEWLGIERIVRAFAEDAAGAMPFLGLTDSSDRGRTYLINEIARRQPPGSTSLLAFLIHAGTADSLDFLDGLDAPRAVEVFAELLSLAGRSGSRLSDRKTQRVADALGAKIAAGGMLPFLHTWMAQPAPEEAPLGLRLLGVLGRTLPDEALVEVVGDLSTDELRKFLTAVVCCAGFPYEQEMVLAHTLTDHPDQEVRDWARGRLPTAALEAPVAQDLPLDGLCARLRAQPTPGVPDLRVCVALLAACDPLQEVSEQFVRFGSEDAAFLGKLEAEAVRAWRTNMNLPLQGHAWLYRWEEHAFAALAHLQKWPGGLVEALRAAANLPSAALRQRLWEVPARVFALWRWHGRQQLIEVCTEPLTSLLVEALATTEGESAARMLLTLREAGTAPQLLEGLRPRITQMLPSLPAEVWKILAPWIDTRGLRAAPNQRAVRLSAAEQALQEMRTCNDLDHLEQCCAHENVELAQAAAERLLSCGEAGAERLARVLGRGSPVPALAALSATVTRWPEGPALAAVRQLVQAEAPPETRFRLGVALLERGEKALLPHLLNAACREAEVAWFRPEDWQRLLTLGVEERTLALSLAASPQPSAYLAAVEHLLAREPDAAGQAALLGFLEAGSDRLRELRVKVARLLHAQGEWAVFPILLGEAATGSEDRATLLRGAAADLVHTTVTALLLAGPRLIEENRLLRFLQADGVDPDAREVALAQLLDEAATNQVRQQVLARLRRSPARERKLRSVAETFAWGVRLGRELTGRLFTLEMIAGQDLGYTRLETNKLFINPLPLLRAEQNGRAVVEALILHELGHHVHHRGEQAREVWKQAGDEKLFPLLNLVADEHLERNLRAVSRQHGDKLKKLNAYAFQHSAREVAIESLLDGLQGRAAEVLTATPLAVARRAGCVAVDSGMVLQEMERAGLAFPRFMRALRMGLGNRHDDPKVAEGLALFRGAFRKSSMPELLEVARRLRDIFGWETELLSSMSQDAALCGDAGELLRVGEGITDNELQDAIQRILEPKSEQREGPAVAVINISPDEQFRPIPSVIRLPHDPVLHAAYAQEVARPARHMRRFLQELGLAYEPERFRLRGHRLDRTRLRAAVLRGDPRLLIARELRIRSDLFLGVVIDCSGSMGMSEKIEKAKRFGVLLAEAARGQRGVDLRLFGFTDSVIYDAGDAVRCAVSELSAGGGNNDAGALWHAAEIALDSRRRAKLLVMISDGLPTECSVAALRALVTRLTTRRKICCAQVAVQPLEEVCFPHYVVLEESAPEASVRQFGTIVARLVRRAMQL